MIHLTQSERDRISQAVLEAEKLTTGEIVPMIVAQSDDYPGARWRLAIVIALLFGFLAYFFLDYFYPACILWVQIPLLYIGYFLVSFTVVLPPFLASSNFDYEVHHRSLLSFFSSYLHSI